MFGFDRQQQAILHLTWIAFFLTFVAWFNLAPFNTTLMRELHLTESHIRILMIANIALTIPARVVIGSLVDSLGPRRVFVWTLLFAGAVSFFYASAQSFETLLASRLLMGMVGAGFVVGIKMIAEHFPPQKMGTAQGLYAGWGNFGAAAATFGLPVVAGLFAPDSGWRIAGVFSGLACVVWAWVYHRYAQEASENNSSEFKVGLEQAIEVTCRFDVALQIILLVPIYTALGILAFKLATPPAVWLSPTAFWGVLFVLSGLFAWNTVTCIRLNIDKIVSGIPEEKRYAFKQIVILSLVYALTFGSELSVVSMFPQYLETNFGLSVTLAGILGSSFSFLNLVTRPSGGWLADHFGRRRILFLLVTSAGICYWMLGQITSAWSVALVIGLAVLCSSMIQAGNGACFSMVPLIRRDLTGQLAGVVGAYGNVGAVLFLTVLSVTSATHFFSFIAGSAFLVIISLLFLDPLEKPQAT